MGSEGAEGDAAFVGRGAVMHYTKKGREMLRKYVGADDDTTSEIVLRLLEDCEEFQRKLSKAYQEIGGRRRIDRKNRQYGGSD